MKETLNRFRWVIWLGIVAFLLATMVYLYYFYPAQSIGPQQPISFSHRVHAGVKEISCRFCHPYASRSKNAGLPPVALCFFCHKYIIPQHPEIVKERRYLETQTPVPWIRIFYVPDYVKFNHQPHIRKGIDCTQCHGDVKRYDRLVPVDFKMGFCVDCHREKKGPLDCWLGCHH